MRGQRKHLIFNTKLRQSEKATFTSENLSGVRTPFYMA